MHLIETLRARLAKDQQIPFVDFMQIALYDPNEGYYSSGLAKLGKEGDFITAPELSPLFGQTLAVQCQQVLQELDTPCLFEFGAGSGRLCVDILSHLQTLNCLPQNYYILEVSSNLKQRQQQLIEQTIPQLADRVSWLNSWPKSPFNGLVIANEVLDAMPVHRFMHSNEEVLESYICLDEQQQLTEQFKPCTNQRLIDYLKYHVPLGSAANCSITHSVPTFRGLSAESMNPVNESQPLTTEPYTSEVNLFVEDWLRGIYNMLNQGAVLLIDYGFPRHEYYHPDRNQGTLMCHYQHRAHTDFLSNLGRQDITAHVDFTQVAEAAHDAGFHIAGYTNQASFLLSSGLLSLVNALPDTREQFKANQAIKQLTHPSEMGELFKVIGLTKNLEIDLQGFQLHDKRVSL